MQRILHEEFLKDAFTVAKDTMLGAYLFTNIDGNEVGGIVTEVEVYIGGEDKGSHSYGNKRTKRTEIQYGEGGRAYVYMIYGLHHQFCAVTNVAGTPNVVLVRAIEPVFGIDIMKARRGVEDIRRLTVGPGNVCRALGISMEQYGESVTGDKIYFCRDEKRPPISIRTSSRIGIDYAEEYKDKPWRYYIEGNSFVSKPR